MSRLLRASFWIVCLLVGDSLCHNLPEDSREPNGRELHEELMAHATELQKVKATHAEDIREVKEMLSKVILTVREYLSV